MIPNTSLAINISNKRSGLLYKLFPSFTLQNEIEAAFRLKDEVKKDAEIYRILLSHTPDVDTKAYDSEDNKVWITAKISGITTFHITIIGSNYNLYVDKESIDIPIFSINDLFNLTEDGTLPENPSIEEKIKKIMARSN